MHLVELSVMEQRYQAVMAVVQDGWKVTEVAEHFGVARQSVHNWIARYEAGGLPLSPTGHTVPPAARTRSPPSSRPWSARSAESIRAGVLAASFTS